jgi:flagellar protein FliS
MLATAQVRRTSSDNAFQTYKQTQVQTADKAQLVILMFEGAIRFCKTMKLNIHEGNIKDCYYYQTKALQVMTELSNSLNSKDTKLGKTLFNLYEYITVELAKINPVDKDSTKLVEVTGILEELLVTLKQAFGFKIKNGESR